MCNVYVYVHGMCMCTGWLEKFNERNLLRPSDLPCGVLLHRWHGGQRYVSLLRGLGSFSFFQRLLLWRSCLRTFEFQCISPS